MSPSITRLRHELGTTRLAAARQIRQANRMDTPEKPPIAFICAMPMELSPLVKKLDLHKTEIDGVEVHRGTLDGRKVVAIVTGMGTKLASEAIERLLDATPVDRVLVVGVAGALDNETPIGTLILPEVVVYSATSAEYRPEPLGGGTPNGKMRTGDELEVDPQVMTELRAGGVVALEMETAVIAESCERRGIPWSVFRAISDRPDSHVDEEVFRLSNQDGTPNPKAVAAYFAKHPQRIPRMARLAKGAKLATQTAADAAIRAATGT
jgi:adenosylhomocysteine nucleosidase